MQKELADLGRVEVGGAVRTTAGNLPQQWIIHAVGPRFQEEDTDAKLGATVRAALRRAEEARATRVAFPAMGAGYYGIPNDVCARVMLETIRAHLAQGSSLTEIIICVLDAPQFAAFESRMGPGAAGPGGGA